MTRTAKQVASQRKASAASARKRRRFGARRKARKLGIASMESALHQWQTSRVAQQSRRQIRIGRPGASSQLTDSPNRRTRRKAKARKLYNYSGPRGHAVLNRKQYRKAKRRERIDELKWEAFLRF